MRLSVIKCTKKSKQTAWRHHGQWSDRLYWTVWPTELCGGRIKEQLLCHRGSQLSGVCVKALREQSPSRLNLSFSPAAGSGIWQRVSGKGVSMLQPLGLLWAYIITSQRCSSGVTPSWRLLGGSPVASCGCSGHCGKVKCWSFPRGEIWSRSCMIFSTSSERCLPHFTEWLQCFVLVQVWRNLLMSLHLNHTSRILCQKDICFY